MIEQSEYGDVRALRLSWPRSQFAGYGVYVFLVRGVFIDCGFPGIAAEFGNVVQTVRPRGVFVTHHHEDHAGNIELLAIRGIPLAMDDVTASLLNRPAPIGLYRHLMWKAAPPLQSTIEAFADDTLSLVSTPGHCRNHHSVWDASTGTLFAGDLFLGVKVRVAHASEHPRQHVSTLREMAALKPERLFCAHRGYVENATRVLSDKADWMEALIARVEARIDDGLSDDNIRRELVGPLGPTHFISAGDYSPRNLIISIRKTRHDAVVASARAAVSAASVTPSAPREHR